MWKYYIHEYYYNIGVKGCEPCIMYVVRAITTQDAFDKMKGIYHLGYVEIVTSNISLDEYELLKTTEMTTGVWRVTREETPIVRIMNQTGVSFYLMNDNQKYKWH